MSELERTLFEITSLLTRFGYKYAVMGGHHLQPDNTFPLRSIPSITPHSKFLTPHLNPSLSPTSLPFLSPKGTESAPSGFSWLWRPAAVI